MRLNEQLMERESELKNIEKEIKVSLSKAPKGRLRISRSGRYVRYYHVTKKGSGKYLGSKNLQIARGLAQKDYNAKIMESVEKELNLLGKYRSFVEAGTYEGIFDSLSEERKKLVMPAYLSDEEFVKNWLSRDYVKMGFKEGEPVYETKGGTKTRSKSEALIVNSLDDDEVPCLYEVPLFLKGYGTVHPDFLVLNVRTRKEYVWEHFGMLDDPYYLKKAMKKIELYIANGYIPGINLIITFESNDHPLELNTVRTLIENYLK
jgi:hypothetical protein